VRFRDRARAGGKQDHWRERSRLSNFDPLRDEASEYAGLLEKDEVSVLWLHMSDQMHGFLTMGQIIRAADTALTLPQWR